MQGGLEMKETRAQKIICLLGWWSENEVKGTRMVSAGLLHTQRTVLLVVVPLPTPGPLSTCVLLCAPEA